ncbi:hypothetical protein ALQ80_200013 [Pseudomonas coronafaciens pv. oryzae]|nr:hypothetical protein ALO86_200263 [Pseudomonas syringae pv. berberidis]RMM31112.1 hypothetical protein ALQ80_200013 [Pseudomonas coronafaciens pv. oryzae]
MIAGPLQQRWRQLCIAFAPKRPVALQARRTQIGLVFDQEVAVGRGFLELVDARQQIIVGFLHCMAEQRYPCAIHDQMMAPPQPVMMGCTAPYELHLPKNAFQGIERSGK